MCSGLSAKGSCLAHKVNKTQVKPERHIQKHHMEEEVLLLVGRGGGITKAWGLVHNDGRRDNVVPEAYWKSHWIISHFNTFQYLKNCLS